MISTRHINFFWLALGLSIYSCTTSPKDEVSGILIAGATLINPGANTEVIESAFIYFDGRTVSLGTSIDNALALLFKKLINDGILKYKIKFN